MTAAGRDGARKLRIVADINACCGYGACKDICPEVFQIERGLVVLTMDTVPPELEEKAIEGAESCPQAALEIEWISE
jgi:ferredoxin